MAIRRVDEFDFQNKRVFIRVDFNVPMDEHLHITDDRRLKAALPTIRHVLSHGGKAILASHLGKPKGQRIEKLSLKPIVKQLSGLLGFEVKMAPDCIGPEVKELINSMHPGEVIVLENLRFHIGEEKNHPEFAQALAELCDIYINDAFGAAHRAHASITGITEYVKEVGSGFLLHNEAKYLGKLIGHPEKPFLVILGGVKVSDKIGVIEQLLNVGDTFLVGGAMATTFLKAMGYNVGTSKFEADKLELKAVKSGVFILPLDVVVTTDLKSGAGTNVIIDKVPDDQMIVDIGEFTTKVFCYEIMQAKTLFWNGPLGAFENPPFDKATFSVAKCIANQNGLVSVVGGGDSAAAALKSGYADKFTHVSTGGGATLEFLEGGTLPGIKALDRY